MTARTRKRREAKLRILRTLGCMLGFDVRSGNTVKMDGGTIAEMLVSVGQSLGVKMRIVGDKTPGAFHEYAIDDLVDEITLHVQAVHDHLHDHGQRELSDGVISARRRRALNKASRSLAELL